MSEPYVTHREFEAFAQSFRSELRYVSDQMTQASSKLDMLIQGRVQEAQVMGELRSTVLSIKDRLDHMEKERLEDRAHIDELYDLHSKVSDGKLAWWGQVAVALIAALAGGVIARWFS